MVSAKKEIIMSLQSKASKAATRVYTPINGGKLTIYFQVKEMEINMQIVSAGGLMTKQM